jgi:hypothetical protein
MLKGQTKKISFLIGAFGNHWFIEMVSFVEVRLGTTLVIR